MFYTAIASLPWMTPSVSKEMLLDALYLSIMSLVSPIGLPYLASELSWQSGIISIPAIASWTINWDSDTENVVIVFTDEGAQSFLVPALLPDEVKDLVTSINNLTVYAFLNPFSGPSHWYGISVDSGGKVFDLSGFGKEMYNSLMEVLDEAICK